MILWIFYSTLINHKFKEIVGDKNTFPSVKIFTQEDLLGLKHLDLEIIFVILENILSL
jgi:hypothetical protein